MTQSPHDSMTQSLPPRFAADRMLGRLARMLRLLGYDTTYGPEIKVAQLRQLTEREGRIILTRGDPAKRFPAAEKVFSVKSEYPPDQLREVVREFALDSQTGLWTRCTLCNAPVERVDKQAVEPQLESKILQLYEDFYRCTGCAQIYWKGSHVERTLRNLAIILTQTDEK